MVTQHRELQAWVEEMAALCQPDSVVWIDGSEEERERLTKEVVEQGEMIPLNQEKLPGCLYHRTAVNDVARTEDLTYICTKLQADAGPTNNWMSPEEGYRRAGEIFRGSMKGRIMYVIPFSMGPVFQQKSAMRRTESAMRPPGSLILPTETQSLMRSTSSL